MNGIARFGREEFLAERWSYQPGEHVTFCGPTQRGKSTLTFQLLERSAHPGLPAVFMLLKPEDETVDAWESHLRYERVPSWPPGMMARWKRPPGYILHPPTAFDPDIDNPRQYREARRAMLHSYRKGNRIVVGDEHYALAQLGLTQEMITLWSRAAAMKTGFWGGVQKPSHIPAWGFNCASHLFLWNDPDVRNIKRFAEFGGIDQKLLAETVFSLEWHETLYLGRRGSTACIVNAS